MTEFEAQRRLPERGSAILLDAFQHFSTAFSRLTLQARVRFEQRDWPGGRRDAVARLAVYREAVSFAVEALQRLLGTRRLDRHLWRRMKAEYAAAVLARGDAEIARTFFNSVTRRCFTTVGVDPEVEFVDPLPAVMAAGQRATEVQRFERRDDVQTLVRDVLQHYAFRVGYADLEEDARRVAQEIETYTPRVGVRAIEVARPLFYRNKGAYVVGRVRTNEGTLPLVLALLHGEAGVVVDAVLLAEQEVSIVFSYTHSYFLVATERPGALVGFLRTLMPHKPVDELYNSIGYNKHGKSELYSALLRHLERTDECFDFAPGQRGMVMVVFTMPTFDVVFKVIRDRFLPPKTATRRQVMEKYNLVFQHDRAGRLVDAQEFEHLRFERRRFAPALLRELQESARDLVSVGDEHVVLRHVYTERRVTPLDLVLRRASHAEALDAVLDYGQALRDLAATNIFPGDLLLKNFGLTSNRRVVFYDYDELCLLTECNFRPLPQPRGDEEEYAEDPWFYAGEHDVFPEEFGHFLELRGPLKQAFVEAHGDLLRVDFWYRMQQAQAEGSMLDLFPYRSEHRLRRRSC